MSADEYVPSEDDVRETWVAHESKCAWGPYHGDPTADFDRFLARVRRDAEAELDSWMARAYETEGKLWKAEARIKAALDVLYQADDDFEQPSTYAIRRALESVPPPSA